MFPSPSHLVLIIEDNEEIREVLAILLEGDGYCVATAGNGQEALDVLREGLTPCLILLDYNMPVMDGRAFRELQLAAHLEEQVPALLLSADTTVRTEGMKIKAVIRKPFDYGDLLRLVGVYSSSS